MLYRQPLWYFMWCWLIWGWINDDRITFLDSLFLQAYQLQLQCVYSWNAVFNWIANRKAIICQAVYLLSSKTVTIHAKPWHTPPFCGPLIVITLIRLLEKQIPFWKPKWLTACVYNANVPDAVIFQQLLHTSVWTQGLCWCDRPKSLLTLPC